MTPLPRSRFMDPANPLTAAWLTSWLEADEQILAVLRCAEDVHVHARLLGASRVPLCWVLTTTRVATLGLDDVGEATVEVLPAQSFTVQRSLGRDKLIQGDREWALPLGGGERFSQLAPLAAFGAEQRLRELARLDLQDFPEHAHALLQRLETLGGPQDRLLAALVGQQDLAEPLAGMRARDPSGQRLASLLEGWSFGADALMAIVVAGVDQAPEQALAMLPLHRLAHQRAGEGATDEARRAADVALAEHLMLVDQAQEAEQLLKGVLDLLPAGDLHDLLPPDDADLTSGEGGQIDRVRVLELLACARGETESPDATTLTRLAELQPLVPGRVQDLARVATGDLLERAQRVLEVHQALAPASPGSAPASAPGGTLSTQQLEEVLRHPSARTGGALGWVQAWLAKQDTPDRSTIKAYCEPLSRRRHGEAAHAMADALVALGMPATDAYVSHGELGAGLRAYEGSPNYLLIGGRHLYDEHDEHLLHAELSFAVGAELAHLRFGHARVTSGEVWDGAVQRVRQVFDLTATALTLGSYAPVGKLLGNQRTYSLVTSVFSPATLARIYKVGEGEQLVTHVGENFGTLLSAGAGAAEKVSSATNHTSGAVNRLRSTPLLGGAMGAGSLGVRQTDLVAAHRVMQLTADRAGLVLCGDIGAAVRAIFLTDRDSKAELAVAERQGLAAALSRRDSDGQLLHQELAIRIGALLAFYLSDDYTGLRAALAPAIDTATDTAGEE